MRVFGLGLDTIRGPVAARIEHPLLALKQFGVSAQWGFGELEIGSIEEAGILVLHRAYLNQVAIVSILNKLIEKALSA